MVIQYILKNPSSVILRTQLNDIFWRWIRSCYEWTGVPLWVMMCPWILLSVAVGKINSLMPITLINLKWKRFEWLWFIFIEDLEDEFVNWSFPVWKRSRFKWSIICKHQNFWEVKYGNKKAMKVIQSMEDHQWSGKESHGWKRAIAWHNQDCVVSYKLLGLSVDCSVVRLITS